MTDADSFHLDTKLALKWLHGDTYEATVTVTKTDTCFHAGDLKEAVPPGPILPDLLYLTWSFTHTGKLCGQIVEEVKKSIQVQSSLLKKSVAAYCVVNGTIAGEDKKPFPRKENRDVA